MKRPFPDGLASIIVAYSVLLFSSFLSTRRTTNTAVEALLCAPPSSILHKYHASKVISSLHLAASKSRTPSSSPRKSTAKRKSTETKINDIVAKIGLTPAASLEATTTAKTTASSTTISEEKSNPLFDDKPTRIIQPASDASSIDLKTQLDYARNGHAVLRNFVDTTILQTIRSELRTLVKDEEILAWRQKVQVASNDASLASSCQTIQDCQAELKKLGITESLPFLQHFNTFRKLKNVRTLAYSLGEAASILLDVPTVRFYQDSLFWKRVGDGPTPWHVDARMAPFDTTHFITFWIPLQDIARDGGTGLLFCSKSHNDFALPYWNSLKEADDVDSEWNRLEYRYPTKPVHYMPMSMGDCTVHSGWTLHCADGADNTIGSSSQAVDRMALAISFVDANAEIRSDAMDDQGLGDNEDRWSYQEWANTVEPRTKFRHELVPIVWPIE